MSIEDLLYFIKKYFLKYNHTTPFVPSFLSPIHSMKSTYIKYNFSFSTLPLLKCTARWLFTISSFLFVYIFATETFLKSYKHSLLSVFFPPHTYQQWFRYPSSSRSLWESFLKPKIGSTVTINDLLKFVFSLKVLEYI